MQLTINSGLALQTAVRKRISELQPLRTSVAVQEETSYMGETKAIKSSNPQYDVKAVDTKIVIDQWRCPIFTTHRSYRTRSYASITACTKSLIDSRANPDQRIKNLNKKLWNKLHRSVGGQLKIRDFG